MSFLKKIFSGNKEVQATWETIPVRLTPDAVELVTKLLSEQNLPVGGFGGAVTALRLIEQAARDQFGPVLMNPQINPIPAVGIQLLIDKGSLDLTADNLKRASEERA